MTISNEPAFKPATTIEEFIALEEEAIAYRRTELAKAGNAQAMRAVLAHVAPTRPPVPEMGPLETPADLAAAHQSIVRAVGAGRLTVSEGLEFAQLVNMAGEAIRRRNNEAAEEQTGADIALEEQRSARRRALRRIPSAKVVGASEPLKKVIRYAYEAGLTVEQAEAMRATGRLPTKKLETAMNAFYKAVGIEERSTPYLTWLFAEEKEMRRETGVPELDESPSPPPSQPKRPKKAGGVPAQRPVGAR